MRYGARISNKYVPSFEELNKLLLNCNMLCPCCEIKMVWTSKQANRSKTISLQHNNDGTIQFLCCSCNCGHGYSNLGDKYLIIPKDHKYCSYCNMILNKIQFHKNKNTKDGLCYRCKKCKCAFDKNRNYLRK